MDNPFVFIVQCALPSPPLRQPANLQVFYNNWESTAAQCPRHRHVTSEIISAQSRGPRASPRESGHASKLRATLRKRICLHGRLLWDVWDSCGRPPRPFTCT
ncbi:uncharacterized protein [Dermacentor albipictus]|uniref:uncharacterized protein isoform X2 n=1 Tax=Dermacentor albipictus TaxID=60249 RepID=UPI0031FCF0FE